MKKLLAVLLAMVSVLGAGSVLASAITNEEYDDAYLAMQMAFLEWFNENGIPAKLDIMTDDQRLEYYDKRNEMISPIEAALDRALDAEDYDAALAAAKEFFVQCILLNSETFELAVPNALWAAVGGKPAGPGTAPDAPSFFAKVWRFILRWIFFGWLWMG